MITVTVYQDSEQEYTGITLEGHADYDEYGRDIICASVSVLAINMANSVESFTNDRFECDMEEETGYFSFRFLSEISLESKLLMNSFMLGIQDIKSSYGDKYIKIRIKEV